MPSLSKAPNPRPTAKTIVAPKTSNDTHSSQEQHVIARHLSPSPALRVSSQPMPPFLLCSLGNPGAAYASTLHSAGHVFLNAVRSHLGAPYLSKDRSLGNGFVSETSDFTLWQSPSYMNESGKALRKAYDTWLRGRPDGRLVIVHDELERPLGSVSVRTGGSKLSARGHNGIKSCLVTLRGAESDWVRVGVGIGRPASREASDVAAYVLRKMNATEKEKVEGCVEEVLEKLRGLG